MLESRGANGKAFLVRLPQFEQSGQRGCIQVSVYQYRQCFQLVLRTRTELGTVLTVEKECASERKDAT